MNWLDTASGWFIAWATSPSAPYLLIAAVALIFAAVVLLVRSWLDRQETKSLASYRGHVPPRPFPVPSNPVQRPLHTAKVPQAKECCGACDGSKCGTDPYRHVGERTQVGSTTVTMFRPTPQRNQRQPSGAYLGSYYGAEIDRILNSESPAPVDSDKQGREFQ